MQTTEINMEIFWVCKFFHSNWNKQSQEYRLLVCWKNSSVESCDNIAVHESEIVLKKKKKTRPQTFPISLIVYDVDFDWQNGNHLLHRYCLGWTHCCRTRQLHSPRCNLVIEVKIPTKIHKWKGYACYSVCKLLNEVTKLA